MGWTSKVLRARKQPRCIARSYPSPYGSRQARCEPQRDHVKRKGPLAPTLIPRHWTATRSTESCRGSTSRHAFVDEATALESFGNAATQKGSNVFDPEHSQLGQSYRVQTPSLCVRRPLPNE